MTRTATLSMMAALAEHTDTELVIIARQGQSDAFSVLFDRWFDRVWNVANNILRDADLAADIAQDTFCVAWENLGQLRDPEAFGGWILRSSRNRALNKLQKEKKSISESGDIVSAYQDHGHHNPVAARPAPLPDEATESRDQQDLIWAATAALGAREASIADLHLRHGLGASELAEELDVTVNNAHQLLHRLKGKLGDVIGHYLLWRDGRASCAGLDAAVAGAEAFDHSVSKAVRRHQKTCEECNERRKALVSPAQLFAATPLMVPPVGLKDQVAAGLQSQGILSQAGMAPNVRPDIVSSATTARARVTSNVRSNLASAGMKTNIAKVAAGAVSTLLVVGACWWLIAGQNDQPVTATPSEATDDSPLAEASGASTAISAGSQTAGSASDLDNKGLGSGDGGEPLDPPDLVTPTTDTSELPPPSDDTTIVETPPSDPTTTTGPRRPVELRDVPNVVGLSKDRATTALEKVGFKVQVTTMSVGRQSPELGLVIAQDPGPQTQQPEGSSIKITVGEV